MLAMGVQQRLLFAQGPLGGLGVQAAQLLQGVDHGGLQRSNRDGKRGTPTNGQGDQDR